jgi:alpha-D-xyloside xylohydrolase
VDTNLIAGLEALEPPWSALPPISVAGPVRRPATGLVEVLTTAGPLRVTGHRDGVRLRMGREDLPAYPILVAEPEARPLELTETRDAVTVRWDDFALTLRRDPLSFVLARSGRVVQQSARDGHFVRRHRLPPFARLPGAWALVLDLGSGEPVYGLGEKWGPLNKRGQLLRSRVHDALGVNAERAYKNTPFAWSPRGWGVFVHTPGTVTHAAGHPLWSHRAYALVVDDEALDVFLLAGADGPTLLAAYARLTGGAPAPPRWSLGVILSRAYYRTSDEILGVAREVRARSMPCETITFDGRAWQDTATRFRFAFDRARYPDARAVIGELKGLGFRICVWEYPLVSVHGPLFPEMAARGWLLRDRATGGPYVYRFSPEPFGDVLTPLPDSGLVDFTHPGAYRFWRDEHAALFDLGVDMIKADFGEQVESEDIVAHNGDGGRRLRNVYPLLYAKCVHEAAERYGPSGPCLLLRAGWAGSQRYPVPWGGDPQADWEGLAASIRGGLSWGMSGGPYHAHDIGGFYLDARDPELYVRWAQAAIFFSHVRFHGVGPREPWSYGAAAEAAVRSALELRQRLLPYLWREVEAAARTALPVQRAMPLAVPDDPAAWAFEQQWMCGPDILVLPCLEPGGRVSGYLPRGTWQRMGDDRPIDGGRVVELTLALEEVAAFTRAGTDPLRLDSAG